MKTVSLTSLTAAHELASAIWMGPSQVLLSYGVHMEKCLDQLATVGEHGAEIRLLEVAGGRQVGATVRVEPKQKWDVLGEEVLSTEWVVSHSSSCSDAEAGDVEVTVKVLTVAVEAAALLERWALEKQV